MNKLFIAILITISTSIFAQNQIAKDILDNLSAKTKTYKNITIEFDFIFKNTSQNINEKQKGELILEDNNFKLQMEKELIINNGETQWVYLADINEVQIMDHDPEDNIMSPNKLFTIYEEGYKHTYIGTESNEESLLHIIDLFPEESSVFMKIRLNINSEKDQLNNITIFDKNGGTYSYKIHAFITNSSNLDPFTFNLSKYPNIEVIDLR